MLLRKLLPWPHPQALTPRIILLSRYKHTTSTPFADDDGDPPFKRLPGPSPPRPPPAKQQPKTPTLAPNQIRPTEPLHSDLPFDFRYSYSESDSRWRPIGFREPTRFSPFGPGRLDRKWDGVSAASAADVTGEGGAGGGGGGGGGGSEEVLGKPLSEEEAAELVERYRHNDCSRQINLGKGGVTHNLLDDIHNHWKRAEAVRIKCLGVPTLDMDNVCFHLEVIMRIKLEEKSSIAT